MERRAEAGLPGQGDGSGLGDGDLRRLREAFGVRGKVAPAMDLLRLSRNDHAPGAGQGEEPIEEVVVPTGLQGGGGCEHTQLLGVLVEAEAVAEVAQQVGHLGAGRAAVHVEFVEDQGEAGVRGLLQPLPRGAEDVLLLLAEQHDVQHRVVGDHDVRRRCLHVPAGMHLRSAEARDEGPQLLVELLVGLALPFLNLPQVLPETEVGRLGIAAAGDGGGSGVAAEVEAVSVALPVQPPVGLTAVQRLPKPGQLVVGEGVSGVEDQHPHGGGVPVLAPSAGHIVAVSLPPFPLYRTGARPVGGLGDQVGEDRQQEGLRLAGTGACGDHEVLALARGDQRVVLMLVEAGHAVGEGEAGELGRVGVRSCFGEGVRDADSPGGVLRAQLDQRAAPGPVVPVQQVAPFLHDGTVVDAERCVVVAEERAA